MNWRTGTPPADKPGWYQADYDRLEGVWRWWNGSAFSLYALEIDSADSAAECAVLASNAKGEIAWKFQPRWYARWLRKRGLPTGVTQ